MSSWDFRKFPAGNSGLINGPKQVYVALALFAVPALLGVLAARGKLARSHGIRGGVLPADVRARSSCARA